MLVARGIIDGGRGGGGGGKGIRGFLSAAATQENVIFIRTKYNVKM